MRPPAGQKRKNKEATEKLKKLSGQKFLPRGPSKESESGKEKKRKQEKETLSTPLERTERYASGKRGGIWGAHQDL